MKTSNKILFAIYGIACLSVLSFVIGAKANDVPLEERITQAEEEGYVLGNNEMKTETKSFESFNTLVIKDHVSVELVQGQPGKVEVNGEENIIPLINFTTENGILTVGMEDKNYNNSKPLSVVIEVNESLEIIRALDRCYISNVGELSFDQITLENQGFDAKMDLNLEADSINVAQEGNGSIDLNGSTSNLSIASTGSGNFESRGLSAKSVQISSIGSIFYSVNATESLAYDLRGSGKFRYTGNPTDISEQTVGSFKIRKED